jgi:hypothetical protein
MGSLRISDADREAAVDLLAEQYAVGRLTKAEFDERSDAAWSARTEGDLAPVFVDLPVRSPISGTARPGREPARVTGRPSRRWPVPLPPVMFALIILTVVTHLPFILIGLVAWFVLFRWRGPHRWHPPHAGTW